jgi:hypothetical protein
VSTRRSAVIAALFAAATAAAVTGCASGHPAGRLAKSAASPSAAAVKGTLAISGPYIPKPVGEEMAAAYFVVRDTGTTGDHLDRVTAPGFAREVQAHTTKNDKMVMVKGYDVPARGTLRLALGGNHLMLTKLSRMPRVGDMVTLRLYFAKAGRVDLRVPVKPATYRPPNGTGGSMPGMGEHSMDGHGMDGGSGHGEG